MQTWICPFSCPGLDQHGPHSPESDPALAGPHIHWPPASGVPLHQSADLSRDWPQSAAGGAWVARAGGARLWHHPVMTSLFHVLYSSPQHMLIYSDAVTCLTLLTIFIVVHSDLCVIQSLLWMFFNIHAVIFRIYIFIYLYLWKFIGFKCTCAINRSMLFSRVFFSHLTL